MHFILYELHFYSFVSHILGVFAALVSKPALLRMTKPLRNKKRGDHCLLPNFLGAETVGQELISS